MKYAFIRDELVRTCTNRMACRWLEVSPKRQTALACRWLILYSKTRRGQPMRRALAMEVLDAYNNQGSAVKKRDDTHKMAQANKAFAHYKW